MPGAELKTYSLSAVLTVLLGAGIGVGWHYIVDSAGVGSMALAATPPAKQDAPGPALACPPGPREVPALDVPRSPVSSRPDNQLDPAHVRGATRVTHARTHPPRPTGANAPRS
jgi:hypothetical protein